VSADRTVKRGDSHRQLTEALHQLKNGEESLYNLKDDHVFEVFPAESVTHILFNLGLLSFNTVLHNCKAVLLRILG